MSDELACTLLAVPAVPEAIDFLEAWLARSGNSPRKMGMLAWALGAAGEYERAESLWREILETASADTPEDVAGELRSICETLVDCFHAANEFERARKVAQQGWELYRNLVWPVVGPVRGDQNWLSIFLQAGLEVSEIARTLLEGYSEASTPQDRAADLCIRAYIDDPEAVTKGWLEWVGKQIASSRMDQLEEYRGQILRPLRQRGLAQAYLVLSQATWQRLQGVEGPGVEDVRRMLNWERFNYFPYVDLGDWPSVERVSWDGIRESGYKISATGLIMAAAAQSKPTPEELMLAVEKDGVSSVDEYGLCGWYMLAREAAASGNVEKAFQDLDRSVSYWSNPPLYFLNLWEKDTYWGELRDAPEYKHIFSAKRDRIGPVYGMLHYFPGW